MREALYKKKKFSQEIYIIKMLIFLECISHTKTYAKQWSTYFIFRTQGGGTFFPHSEKGAKEEVSYFNKLKML